MRLYKESYRWILLQWQNILVPFYIAFWALTCIDFYDVDAVNRAEYSAPTIQFSHVCFLNMVLLVLYSLHTSS